MTVDTPVSMLNGVGKTRAAQLEKLGIATIGDLIYFFPRAFEKRGNISKLSALDTEHSASYLLTVSSSVSSAKIRQGLTISKFRAFDESGTVEIVFFNSPYIKDVFTIGSIFRFWGKISLQKRTLQLTNPKYEPYVEGIPLPDYTPIYPLTDGLSSKQIDKLIKIAINDVLPQIIDPLPDNIRLENSLPTLVYSIKNAHL